MTATASGARTLGVNRLEALTDGIYAVAMTLLVVDLKLPEAVQSDAELPQALLALWPRFESWMVSFGVLALFWFGHYRAFSRLRQADGRLTALTVGQLACVTLMPFCCELLGRFGSASAQAVYALEMTALGLLSLAASHYVYRHPELVTAPVSRAAHRGAQLRIVGLIVISIVAVPLALVWEGEANWAYLLMAVVMPLSHRIERRGDALDA
jgi:uncharacterized membrane protein